MSFMGNERSPTKVLPENGVVKGNRSTLFVNIGAGLPNLPPATYPSVGLEILLCSHTCGDIVPPTELVIGELKGKISTVFNIVTGNGVDPPETYPSVLLLCPPELNLDVPKLPTNVVVVNGVENGKLSISLPPFGFGCPPAMYASVVDCAPAPILLLNDPIKLLVYGALKENL